MSGNMLLMHFNNDSSGLFKENDTHVYDWSGSGNNGTVIGGSLTTVEGKNGRAMQIMKNWQGCFLKIQDTHMQQLPPIISEV